MIWPAIERIVPCIVATLVSTWIGFYAWRRRRVPGALWYALMMWAQALWVLGYLFELLAPSLDGKIIWDDLQLIPALAIPPLFLAFAVDYAGVKVARPRLLWSAVASIATAYMLIVFFGPREWHMVDFRLVPGMPFNFLMYEFPPLVSAMALYSYVLMVAGGVLLVRHAIRSPRYRPQTTTVLLGVAVPFIGSLLSLFGLLPASYRDMSPVSFSIGSLIVMWGMFRYHLLGVVPAPCERAFERIRDAVVVLDEWYIIGFNRAAQALFGDEQPLQVGETVEEALAHWPVLLEHCRSAAETHIEFTHQVAGEERHFDAEMLPLPDLGERARLMVVRDITVQKRAELSLRESEERYRRLVEMNPAAIAIICDGKVVYANQACENLLGSGRAETIVGRSMEEFVLPDELHRAIRRVTEILEGKRDFLDRRKLVRLNGEVIYVDIAGIPIKHNGCQAVQFVFWEITAQVRAEEEQKRYRNNLESLVAQRTAELERVNRQLRESEARLRALINATPDDIVCFKDGDGCLAEANASYLRLFGLDETTAYRGKHITELLSGRDDIFLWEIVRGCEEKDETAWQQGNPIRADEEIPVSDGSRRVYDVIRVPMFTPEGERLGLVTLGRDITARVRAEEELRRHRDRLEELVAERAQALQESEERFRSIVEQSHDGIAVASEEGVIIEWNRGSEEIFGIKREEAIGQFMWDVQYRVITDEHKDVPIERLRDRILRAVRDREAPWFNRVQEAEIQRPDGERRFAQTVVFPIQAGDKFMLGSIVRDVTRRKQTAAELRRLKLAVEQSANTVVITDTDGNIEYVNPKFVETTGYTVEEAIGQNPRILKSGEHSAEFYEELWNTITAGRTWKGEFHNRRKDGSLYWERAIISPVHDADGRIINYIAIKEDVTERKKMEESLREREELFRGLVSQMPSGVVILDRDGRIIEWNRAQTEISGIPAEEALGRPFWEVQQRILPERARRSPRVRENIKQAVRRLSAGKPAEHHRVFGQRIRRADGTYRHVQIISFPVVMEHKSLASSITVDITARKEAEDALRRRNAELTRLSEMIVAITSTLELDVVLQRIIESTMQLFPDIHNATIQLLNRDGNLEMRAASSNTPVTEQRLILSPGQGIAGLVMEERRPINVADVAVDQRFVMGETPPVYHSLMAVPLTVHDQFLGTLTITSKLRGAFDEGDERLLQTLAGYAAMAVRNAHLYEQTQRDAETKAMLLKEVNHRVKNNLATIIGLLYAEKRYASATFRDDYRDILGELINRIQGLATVHSMLSASSWKPLHLSDLAMQVIRAPLMVLPVDQSVMVTISPSPVLVSARQASSLALVFNELATNVIKYGLAERHVTHLSVNIIEEEEWVRCEVRDDGPGYPEEVLSGQRHGVGLYLVQTIITRDLNGELTLENDDGAVTVVRFPVER